MVTRGVFVSRLTAAAVLVAASAAPLTPAAASGATDITSKVLAGANVALAGDSIVNLPPGTTTYNGVFSGQGTLTIAGSGTLVLTKNSDITLPASARHQTVTTSGGNWPYPIVSDPDAPAVVVERGATLQYGDGGATGVIGHYPYSWPNIQLSLNEDNIQVDGTLVLDLNGPGVNLGTISGTGLIWQPRTAFDALDLAGTQPFAGVVGLGTGANFGDASYRVALPDARAILDDGSAIFNARDYTLTIPQDVYEQNDGNDVTFHTWQAGRIVMTGVYGYSDSGSAADPTLSDAALNTGRVAHSANVRGVNIEGANVQWGDGTTDRFFLPATPSNSYINIHANGSLALDYDGPVTLDTPISGGTAHDSLSTPAEANITISPTPGNAVTVATPQNYHGTTTIGTGATLLLGTGEAGGDGTLLSGTPSDAVVDDGTLVVRNTSRAVTLSNLTGSGALMLAGSVTTTLTGTISYTGATTITSGTLALAAGSGGIGASGVGLTAGTLDLSAAPGTTLTSLAEGPAATLVLAPRAGGAALTVGSAVSLAGRLTIKPAGAVPAGQPLTLIHVAHAAPTGTFTGLPEGAQVTVGGAAYHITYHGGAGGDVVLLPGAATPTPTATTTTAVPTVALVTAPTGHGSSAPLLALFAALLAVAVATAVLLIVRRRS